MAVEFAAVGLFTKLLALGGSVWKVHNELKDELGPKDLKALQDLVSLSGGLGKFIQDASSRTADSMATMHMALVVAAFGEAFKAHWVGNKTLAPDEVEVKWRHYLTKNKAERERITEVGLRIESAALKVSNEAAEGSVAELDALLGDPLKTPYYRMLWNAFTNPDLEGAIDRVEAGLDRASLYARTWGWLSEKFGVQPADQSDEDEEVKLIEIGLDGHLEFERAFRAAYAEAMASSKGARVERYLAALRESVRSSLVHETNLRHLLEWRGDHVFGLVSEHQGIPDMPLEEIYVPTRVKDCDDQPATEVIRDALEQSRVVAVRAPFGHGKSLTAKTLAWQWAEEYLYNTFYASRGSGYIDAPPVSVPVEAPEPSTERWLPVFVHCGMLNDVPDDIGPFIQRSQKKLFNLDMKASDPSLLPSNDQRVIFIFDGLDEAGLSPRKNKDFFDRITDFCTENHRAVVLSRPAGLPPERWLEEQGVRSLRLTVFSDAQITEWLERWCSLNQHDTPIRLEEIRERGLGEAAETPILLFMIAYTWTSEKDGSTSKPEALIYRDFFKRIAEGRHEFDKKISPNIADASDELLCRLKPASLGILPQDSKPHDALLWLMSRVAWSMYGFEYESPPRLMDTSDIKQLFRQELKISDERAQDTIRYGLMLAIHGDPSDGRDQLHFSHKSFREFLVACFWEHELKRIVKAPGVVWSKLSEPLMSARLLRHGDASFKFLVQLLRVWPSEDQDALRRWAIWVFNDKRPSEGTKPFESDTKAWLREAALAIGCRLKDAQDVIKDHNALRSLLAWFWLRGLPAIIVAERADLNGANLRRADLSGANLRGADLSVARFGRADLTGADLREADLSGADLREADLRGARLNGASLRGAVLREARLRMARLEEADLNEASLSGADLRGAHLMRADLTGTRLTGTRLTGASLSGANLRGANLRGANLSRAGLSGANLMRANLRGARLSDASLNGAGLKGADLNNANLRGVDLSDADLRGADLSGANLSRANLSGASLSDANLKRAHLTRADLSGAYLSGADLNGANLRRADLSGSDLSGSDLSGASLSGVRYNASTFWPTGFSSPPTAINTDINTDLFKD